LALIEKLNPYWEDLYEKLLCQIKSKLIQISNFKATGLLRRYAPRNDGPKNRTVQSLNLLFIWSL
ncbi:hypothetical protein O6C85_03035, partial [Legionella pneumophila]|nr:hypothetical protein [Legionella pneumophila]